MSDLGRISGSMLKENLLRGGENLVFQNSLSDSLLYIDVETNRIGINTDAPTRDLTVLTAIKTSDLIIDNNLNLSGFNFDGANSILSSVNGPIYISPASNQTIVPQLRTDNLRFSNNTISSLNSNDNIELKPHGIGETIFDSDVMVDGNLHSTGDILIDGQIFFGNQTTDTVSITAEVNTDLIPDSTDYFNLGSSSKKWLDLHTHLVNGQLLSTGSVSFPSLYDIGLDVGKQWFVATNGDDTNVGFHQHGPFATIAKALSVATSGDTVYIYPGTYTEIFPLTVPQGVTVRGAGIRAVTVKPTVSTNTQDCFLLNGETTIDDLSVVDFYYNSVTDTGYAFRFAPGFTVTSRSPYVQNVSVITEPGTGTEIPASVVHGTGPISTSSYSTFGFTIRASDYGDIGGYITAYAPLTAVIQSGYIDPPGYYTVTSIEVDPTNTDNWFIHTAEEFNPSQPGLSLTLYSVGASFIVSNALFAEAGYYYLDYNKSDLPVDFGTTVGTNWIYTVDVNYYGGTSYIIDSISDQGTRWRINFTQTIATPSLGQVLFVSPVAPDGTPVIPLPAGKGALVDGSVANPDSKEASMLFHSCTFITTEVDALTMTNGVRVEWLNSFTYFANKGLYAINGTLGFANQGVKFGAEVRSIGSANVYGTYGAYADGSDTLMYLINHNFAYIGAGTDTSNDPTAVIQTNEASKHNGGEIYYQSLDQRGDFRVGDVFTVNQETGFVTLNGIGQNANGITRITLSNNSGQDTILDPQFIQTGGIKISGNTIYGLDAEVNIDPASNQLNLENVSITQNLSVTGNFIIDGQLTLGNQVVDTISFVADVDSDILPNSTSTYNLGSETLRWTSLKNIRSDLPNIKIYDNNIQTVDTNSDLELRANASGSVVFVKNTEISNTLTVSQTSSFANTFITGSFAKNGTSLITGDINQTGDINISGDFIVNNNYYAFNDIYLNLNQVSTVSSNSDLELVAAGTGVISIPDKNVQLDKNLQVGSFNAAAISVNQVTAPVISDNNIVVYDNVIETTQSNSDLELKASGTGQVDFVQNLEILNDLTVMALSSLKSTQIQGTVTQTGDYNQTGNTTRTGDVNVTSSLTSNGNFVTDSITVSNNTIRTTVSNSDLELAATGNIVINDIARFNNNLTTNTTTSTNLTAISTTSSGVFSDGDIKIEGNLVTTTQSNSDLDLRANGTGIIRFTAATFNNQLSVTGISDLQATNIVGDVTVQNLSSSSITHTGSYQLYGTGYVTGDFTNTSVTQANFGNIVFLNNAVKTTESNSDLTLNASGTGSIRLKSQTTFNKNLSVNDTLTVNNLTVNKVTFNSLTDGTVLVKDNFITTVDSNADLDLTSHGTGIVRIPSNDLRTYGLTVAGTSYFNNTFLGGGNHLGNFSITGNRTVNGSYYQTGDFTNNNEIRLDNIHIVNNTILTTLSSSDLELRASGSGLISFTNNNVLINNNLSVSQDITSSIINTSSTSYADSLYDGEILIKDNFIRTTNSNSNLKLTGNLLGGVASQNVLINNNVISPVTFNDLLIQPNGIVTVDSVSAMKLPTGTTANRPSGVAGQIRYNTTAQQFRGWNSAATKPFNGVYSADLKTSVTALDTQSLRFTVNNANKMSITSSKAITEAVQVNTYMTVSNNTFSNALNENIFITPGGTGQPIFDKTTIVGDAFINLDNTLPLTVASNGQGYVKFNNNKALVIPVGNTSERPAGPEVGDFRFNTDLAAPEVWNGVAWASLAGDAVGISASEFNDLDQVYSLIFG